jgi:hypothetical protein
VEEEKPGEERAREKGERKARVSGKDAARGF